MKKLILMIIAMASISCAKLPTYGSIEPTRPMCLYSQDGWRCASAHQSYDASGLHKMYPIDMQGLPGAPALP